MKSYHICQLQISNKVLGFSRQEYLYSNSPGYSEKEGFGVDKNAVVGSGLKLQWVFFITFVISLASIK